MSEELISNLTDQTAKLIEPVREFNKLAVATIEKLTQLQLSSLQGYSDLGIAQLKASAEVSDPESFQAYLGNQSEFLKVLGEKLAEDAQAVAEFSKDFGAEAQQIAKERTAQAA